MFSKNNTVIRDDDHQFFVNMRDYKFLLIKLKDIQYVIFNFFFNLPNTKLVCPHFAVTKNKKTNSIGT